jgi:uncharacterized membrane protein
VDKGAEMGLFRYRSPSGETRPWTLKEIIQGKPIGRPTHPILVMFPITFYVGALVMDLLSRASLPGGPRAGTWGVMGAVIVALPAILTGLTDRSFMRPGSKIRKVATRHMYLQLTATAIFIVNLAVRYGDRGIDKSKPLWILLDILGAAVVIVGGDVGGQMVFKMGYRVGSEGEQATPTPASPADPAS